MKKEEKNSKKIQDKTFAPQKSTKSWKLAKKDSKCLYKNFTRDALVNDLWCLSKL